jgi:hypothetical protein
MRISIFGWWVALVAALLAAPPGDGLAAGPRLFPDLTLRFPVGDPDAENPISDTEGPKTLVAADMNGDGLADVIAGNLDGSLSVLLGRTNGTLAPQLLVPASGLLSNASLRALVAADFNGDGRLDLAAADIAGESVILLLGNGDGTMLPHARTALGPARALAAADFNHDGHVDLVVACSPPDCEGCLGLGDTNASSRFLCILDGRGDGTFAPPRFLLTPGTPACFYDVDAADLDGDGDVDVVSLDFSRCTVIAGIVSRTRRLQVFANDGSGGFASNAPDRVLETAGEGPRAFRLAYLDERSVGGTNPPGATLDLVVANRDSSTLDVFLNLGGLDFTNANSFHAGARPRDVAVGDLDGDGRADLVVVNRGANSISVLRGLGGGAFTPPQEEYPTGVSPRQVALGDFNGDGALDAAVNNRVSEDISLFLGEAGLAGFLVPGGWYRAGISPVSVVAEDFDHDGYPDVAVASLRSHDLRVWRNHGEGTLSNAVVYPVNYEPAIVAADDLDGDGHADLVVSCLGSEPTLTTEKRGSLVTLLGRGDGTFGPPMTSLLGPHLRQPYWLRLADLSGDGVLDAAIGGLSGELVVLRGQGDGTFAASDRVLLWSDGRPLGLAVADFDGDGRLDIATSRGLVFLNDGQFFDGTNGPGGRVTTFNSGFQAWATETEDLDADGTNDLMVALTFVRPDPIGVYFGLGQGTFTQPDIYSGPDVGVVAIVGQDMDGDGVKDLVVGNRCAATVIILQGLGNRRFNYREIINAYSVEDVAVADMNRDGKPDIVGVGGGLWVLLNGGVQQFVTPPPGSGPGTPDRAGLFINELMALNQDFAVTNNTTPDWLELYNHSAVTQSLAGWRLEQYTADSATNRWSFPTTNVVSIPPWGHLVVWCKKKPGNVPGLYATFELSSEGENVALIDPSGAAVDSVSFPALPEDVSYARYFDGARFFAYNPSPSLGMANQRPANLDPTAERKDPYVGPGASTLGLNARLFDDVAIAYAAVCYRLAGQTGFTELPLSDDGRHGDKQPGDGYYGALLPPLPGGAVVEYYVRVVDLEGETGSSPSDPMDASGLHRVTVPQAGSPLRLTELVGANATGLRDERGQYEDWIELLNAGPTAVSLDGLALTKDYFARDSAWHFPSNVWLASGERAIVFCDDDVNQGPLHASFKLTRAGDRVFLMAAAEWRILDSLSFGPLPADTSFGVLGAGTDAQLLAWPTPGAENLPIPPRRAPPGPTPEPFWRCAPTGASGSTNMFTLRWPGPTNAVYRAHGSADLQSWQPSAVAPVHLGEGLFQWSEAATGPGRFYRVSLLP